MIYFPLSKFIDSSEAVVTSGFSLVTEGAALVRSSTSTAQGVTLSTGSGTSELFAGFAVAGLSAAPTVPTYGVAVETYTATATSLNTALPGVSGQLVILNNGPVANPLAVPAALTIDGTLISATFNATNVTIAGTTGLTVGNSYTIVYKYLLSISQARAIQGDVQPGGYAGTAVNQIGVVKRGTIYTSEFDASKNWNVATAIKLNAAGQITDQTGTGTTLVGAYVIAVPTSTVPYLGIEFSAV